MGSFFKQRQKQHLQSLKKYLKYVFNDHLMLFLFFLLGGGMFVYSSFLKQDYHIGIYVSRLIILVIFSVVLLVGKVATLLVDADSVFLLPKQVQLKSYLQKAIQYSFILPFCLIIAVAFIVYPFNKVMNVYTQTSYIMLVISMLCLKYFDLIYQIQTSYFSKY